MAGTILVPKDTPDWQDLLTQTQYARTDAEALAHQSSGDVVLQDGTDTGLPSALVLRDEAKDHAQATSSFTDDDGTSYDKGAKGWAADAEGYKNTAQSEASSASTNASQAQDARDKAVAEADAITGKLDRELRNRVSEETRSHGGGLVETALAFTLDTYVDLEGGKPTYPGSSVRYARGAWSDFLNDIANVGESVRAAIVGGQTYNHEINIDIVDSLIVGVPRNPSDYVPMLDCSDEIPDTDWTKDSSYTNVYRTTKPAVSGSPHTERMWEDDQELMRQGGASDVDANPGSVYFDTSSDPWVIYYHPFGSTDASSDGKRVDYAAREYGVKNNSAANRQIGTVQSIHARRNLNNDGSIVVGAYGVIDRCLAEQGSKHHMLHGGNGIIKDSIMFGDDPNKTSLTAIGIIYYQSDNSLSTPLDCELENIMAIETPNTNPISNASHAGYDDMQIRGGVFVDTPNGPTVGGGPSYFDGIYGREMNTMAAGGTGFEIVHRQNIISNLKKEAPNRRHEGSITIRDSVVFHQSIKGNAPDGTEVVKIENSIVIASRCSNRSSTNPTYIAENCLLVSLYGKDIVNGGYTIEGDNCIFFYGDPGVETNLTSEQSLSDLQSTTGHFSNSVWVTWDQFKELMRGQGGGFWEGDFRLNYDAEVTDAGGAVHKGQLPDGTDLSEVGPNQRWDYGRRKAVEGQWGQWPTPPTTEEECRAYVTAPNAWAWRGEPHDYIEEHATDYLAHYAMDGSAGSDEPDTIGSSDLLVKNGSPGAGSGLNWPYRSVTGTDDLYRDVRTDGNPITDNSQRLWMAAPVRVDSGSSGQVLGHWRGFRNNAFRIDYVNGSWELTMNAGYYKETTVLSLAANEANWDILQAWIDPVKNECGLRVGGVETTGFYTFNSLSWDVNRGTIGPGPNAIADIGPWHLLNNTPRKADRDWMQNGGDFRTKSEVQGYSLRERVVAN